MTSPESNNNNNGGGGGTQQQTGKDKSVLVGSNSSLTEAARGMFCGILYGVTSPLVGHPIDTVKTKMQAQTTYVKGGSIRTLVKVVKTEGFLALYRGLLPPLIGSGIFRSVQFAGFTGAYAWSRDSPFLTSEIPFSGGMQYRVVFSGIFGSTCRAILETPLEFIKVRLQVGQKWRLHDSIKDTLKHPVAETRNIFQGFGITLLRTNGLMTTFFILNDHLARHHSDLISIPVLGNFIKGGVCSTLSWWLIWPFENLKSQVQAETEGVAKGSSWVVRAKHVIKEKGVIGLYRGIGPGSARSLIANGYVAPVYPNRVLCLMLVM
eukprot:gb/GECG01008027.1/.p1 GENE.gb/GECG01008027.1/~~gb/GECG01008027.1/.p1  ORF type:complete len:321 (+),score=19.60 gb/GECG01008027.1/:1-963(+)